MIRELRRTSQRVEFSTDVAGTAPATLRINVYRFPGWTLRVDGKVVSDARVEDPLGRVHVQVPTGTHRVSASFENTPIRAFSEWLSLLGVLAAAVWVLLAWRVEARRDC